MQTQTQTAPVPALKNPLVSCAACHMRRQPTCLLLAVGLCLIAARLSCRVRLALAPLEVLFRPSAASLASLTSCAPAAAATAAAATAAASSTPSPQLSATQLAAQTPLVLSIAFLEEKGGVKAAFTVQHSGGSGGGDSARTPGRQQRRLSKKRQLDSGETPLTQQQHHHQQQQNLLPMEGTGGTGGASGGGRKRRRISSTAAAHDARASGAVAASGAAQAQGAHADAGSKPAAVYGWGVDEGPREFSCRTRRRLLLYLKVWFGAHQSGCRRACTHMHAA